MLERELQTKPQTGYTPEKATVMPVGSAEEQLRDYRTQLVNMEIEIARLKEELSKTKHLLYLAQNKCKQLEVSHASY